MPHGTRFTATATLLLAILLPAVAAQAAPDGAAPAGDATLRAEEEQFDALKTFLKNKQDVEALKREAEKEGDWQLSDDADIPIEQQVLRKPWHRAPFGPRAFDMPVERIARDWDKLMRLMRVPYPSADYLRIRHKKFPDIVNADTFNGDYEQLSRDVLEVWRLFFRGDFQEAMVAGDELGAVGQMAGKLAQMTYAIYLEPDLKHKHMLLQDAINQIRDRGEILDEMRKDSRFHNDFISIRCAYALGIGRIAEDVPIPVAIGRNYVFKLLSVTDDAREFAPMHPMGLTFRAGIDANVVRKLGKATGRITFGAKQTNVEGLYQRALDIVPDSAVIRYEYANSFLYLNNKREIDRAIEELDKAAAQRPLFAMEALDAMYAAKRRKEVRALAEWKGTFRSFERKRLAWQKHNNNNLYCVLPKDCPAFIIQ
jgi:tetratricopeptide (TPR) repeat protein